MEQVNNPEVLINQKNINQFVKIKYIHNYKQQPEYLLKNQIIQAIQIQSPADQFIDSLEYTSQKLSKVELVLMPSLRETFSYKFKEFFIGELLNQYNNYKTLKNKYFELSPSFKYQTDVRLYQIKISSKPLHRESKNYSQSPIINIPITFGQYESVIQEIYQQFSKNSSVETSFIYRTLSKTCPLSDFFNIFLIHLENAVGYIQTHGQGICRNHLDQTIADSEDFFDQSFTQDLYNKLQQKFKTYCLEIFQNILMYNFAMVSYEYKYLTPCKIEDFEDGLKDQFNYQNYDKKVIFFQKTVQNPYLLAEILKTARNSSKERQLIDQLVKENKILKIEQFLQFYIQRFSQIDSKYKKVKLQKFQIQSLAQFVIEFQDFAYQFLRQWIQFSQNQFSNLLTTFSKKMIFVLAEARISQAILKIMSDINKKFGKQFVKEMQKIVSNNQDYKKNKQVYSQKYKQVCIKQIDRYMSKAYGLLRFASNPDPNIVKAYQFMEQNPIAYRLYQKERQNNLKINEYNPAKWSQLQSQLSKYLFDELFNMNVLQKSLKLIFLKYYKKQLGIKQFFRLKNRDTKKRVNVDQNQIKNATLQFSLHLMQLIKLFGIHSTIPFFNYEKIQNQQRKYSPKRFKRTIVYNISPQDKTQILQVLKNLTNFKLFSRKQFVSIKNKDVKISFLRKYLKDFYFYTDKISCFYKLKPQQRYNYIQECRKIPMKNIQNSVNKFMKLGLFIVDEFVVNSLSTTQTVFYDYQNTKQYEQYIGFDTGQQRVPKQKLDNQKMYKKIFCLDMNVIQSMTQVILKVLQRA